MKGRLECRPFVLTLPCPGQTPVGPFQFVLARIGEQSRGTEASEVSPIRRVTVCTLVLILHIASPNFAISRLAWVFRRMDTTARFARSKKLLAGRD
jgi:hypothetical protein